MAAEDRLEPIEGLGKVDSARSAGIEARKREPVGVMAAAPESVRPADHFTLSEEASEEDAPTALASAAAVGLAQEVSQIKTQLGLARGGTSTDSGSRDWETMLRDGTRAAEQAITSLSGTSSAASSAALARPTGIVPGRILDGRQAPPASIEPAGINISGQPPALAHLPGGAAPPEAAALAFNYADSLSQGGNLSPQTEGLVQNQLERAGIGGGSLRQILELPE